MIRIALDASGGDQAPEAPVSGALQAVQELSSGLEVTLVGRRAEIEALLQSHGSTPEGIKVVDAPETIGMAEQPLRAIRKKQQSSVVVGLGLHKRGEADAFVSAGNTGAVMAASTLLLGLHKGIERPAIGTVLPTGGDPVLVLDAGANVDCSPRELLGFARLGAVYARDVLGRAEPTVGLLNIGQEDGKGNAAVREAHGLLRACGSFRFVGNVEGGDILREKCDVFVCDGFVGNVVLKFYESVGRMFAGLLQQELDGEMAQRESVARLFRFLDYSSYGGAPLLGVRGVPVVCHGRSSARAFKNAIRLAVQAATNHLSQDIGAELAHGAVA
ncbi:MAG: phosphate acyltransferase PlsX [Gemmatimonadetes bacterium]|nr:phosphate acyltransferase PlsX [Gemmatimonadota bacterium]